MTHPTYIEIHQYFTLLLNQLSYKNAFATYRLPFKCLAARTLQGQKQEVKRSYKVQQAALAIENLGYCVGRCVGGGPGECMAAFGRCFDFLSIALHALS